MYMLWVEFQNGMTILTSKLRASRSQARPVILPRQSKFERREQPCIHVGYARIGYRFRNYEGNAKHLLNRYKIQWEPDQHHIIVNDKNKENIINFEKGNGLEEGWNDRN